MAISEEIPGLEVTIDVNGQPLDEFNFQAPNGLEDAQASGMLRKYIEAPSGSDFEVRMMFKRPFSPPLPVHANIMFDGRYVQAPWVESAFQDGCEGYKYAKATFVENGTSSTQNFKFSDLVAEEIDSAVTMEEKRRISSVGQITIYLYFVQDIVEATPVEIPRSDLDQSETFSHKAMKASVIAGDSLAYQTSLSAPEVANGVTFSEIKTTDEAFAAFTFYYRSTAALKSLGIISRTPSPSPEPEPEPKDPEAMSEEELRAELIRMINKEREEKEQQLRMKREREDSVATVGGEDDGEVEWLGSQPKRLRWSPGEGDEVVNLEDEVRSLRTGRTEFVSGIW